MSESHVKAVAWWFDEHPWVPPDARLSIESILTQVEPEAPVPAEEPKRSLDDVMNDIKL